MIQALLFAALLMKSKVAAAIEAPARPSDKAAIRYWKAQATVNRLQPIWEPAAKELKAAVDALCEPPKKAEQDEAGELACVAPPPAPEKK
jgi:hypothetical protein